MCNLKYQFFPCECPDVSHHMILELQCFEKYNSNYCINIKYSNKSFFERFNLFFKKNKLIQGILFRNEDKNRLLEFLNLKELPKNNNENFENTTKLIYICNVFEIHFDYNKQYNEISISVYPKKILNFVFKKQSDYILIDIETENQKQQLINFFKNI